MVVKTNRKMNTHIIETKENSIYNDIIEPNYITNDNDFFDIDNYILQQDSDDENDNTKDETYYVNHPKELINAVKDKLLDEEQISDIVDEIFDNNEFDVYQQLSEYINFIDENVLFKQLKRFNVDCLEFFHQNGIILNENKITEIICKYIKMKFKKSLHKLINQINFYNLQFNIITVINVINDTEYYNAIKIFNLQQDFHFHETKENERKDYSINDMMEDPIIDLLNDKKDDEAIELYSYRNYLNLKQDWFYIEFARNNKNKKFITEIIF